MWGIKMLRMTRKLIILLFYFQKYFLYDDCLDDKSQVAALGAYSDQFCSLLNLLIPYLYYKIDGIEAANEVN